MKFKASLIAVSLFLVLAAGCVYLWYRLHVGLVDDRIVLGIALYTSVLLAANTYQSYRSRGSFTLVEMEEMMKDREALFLKIYQNAPVPYILTNGKGVITSTNMAAVRLFNMTEGAFNGRLLFDLIESEDTQRSSLYPEKFKQGVFVNDDDAVVHTLEGETRFILFSLFSFREGMFGKWNGLATLVDITKQKEIDKAKTEFVSLAAHQLRTPIAAIKWNAELLVMKHGAELNESERAYIDAMSANTERMNVLVSDFLDASRFELGTLTAEKTLLEAPAFFDEIMSEHLPRATEMHVSLEREYDPLLTRFTSDSHLLSMTVGNLISNAIKYSHEGGSVHLRVRQVGLHMIIDVKDDGMGIPKAEQDKIFSKIFRASNAQAHVPDGTGLGLYIANEAVKVLGGEVSFASEENVGTTFTITVPL